MINLSRAKLVLFDFDDTLCIHSNHYNFNADSYNKAMFTGDTSWWDSNGCEYSKQMMKLINYCRDNNIDMGLISAVEFCATADVKLGWVKQKYGVDMKNFCVSTGESAKKDMVSYIIRTYCLDANSILFVDDYYKHVSQVASLGVQVASPMEVVNWANKSK